LNYFLNELSFELPVHILVVAFVHLLVLGREGRMVVHMLLWKTLFVGK